MTLLTPDQVCKALGVARRTLKRIVAGGQLRAVRLNARVLRFRPADLDRYIDRHLAA